MPLSDRFVGSTNTEILRMRAAVQKHMESIDAGVKALRQAQHELMVIYLQFGDKENALNHSYAIRLAETAIASLDDVIASYAAVIAEKETEEADDASEPVAETKDEETK